MARCGDKDCTHTVIVTDGVREYLQDAFVSVHRAATSLAMRASVAYTSRDESRKALDTQLTTMYASLGHRFQRALDELTSAEDELVHLLDHH